MERRKEQEAGAGRKVGQYDAYLYVLRGIGVTPVVACTHQQKKDKAALRAGSFPPHLPGP